MGALSRVGLLRAGLFSGPFGARVNHLDPGKRMLAKFIGDPSAKDLLKKFLFNGIDKLGSKTFLDYFPEYRCEDGNINEKRSIIGKSFENRPWDVPGEFIGSRSLSSSSFLFVKLCHNAPVTFSLRSCTEVNIFSGQDEFVEVVAQIAGTPGSM